MINIMNTTDNDQNYEIPIPDYLGGGIIIEEDYTPSYDTGVFIRNALKGQIGIMDDVLDPYLSQTQMPLYNLPEVEYSLAEAARLLSPVRDSIESSLSLNREVSEGEESFLQRYNRIVRALGVVSETMTKPFYEVVTEESMQQQAHAERARKAYEEVEENPTTRQKLLPRIMTVNRSDINPDYWNGSVGRRAKHILDVVDSGQHLTFTSNPRFTDVFSGVASIDMVPFVDNEDDKRILRGQSRRNLGHINSRVAQESRQPKSGGRAHPRQTTGDGVPITTRNKPGV